MTVERDIVAISIPFSAGVALAAFFPPGHLLSCHWAAGACCMVCAAFAAAYCRKGENLAACAAMFFAAGLTCGLTALISIVPESLPWQGTERALRSLSSLIDGIGFENGQTGALAEALLTGDRSELAKETSEAFRKSGAAHILALSGLHLGIIYGIVRRSLFWTGNSRGARIVRTTVTVSAAGFFAEMTGGSASVTRALLFIAINELSGLLPGRRRRPIAVLCTALLIQLAADPQIIKDIGFQLSYMAMLGIFLLFPTLESFYPPVRGFGLMRRIWKASALTISCQIFTAPLAWWYFRSFPVYFLVSNLVALPLSEFFIFCAIACTLAQAFGSCPDILKGLTEKTGQTLIEFLDTIASLT